jgi:hypothetical protein
VIDWSKIITGVLASLLTTTVLWAVGAFHRVTLSLVLPTSAVVAFDAARCPDGREPVMRAEGRVIIGAGKGERGTYKVGDYGGHETLTLLVSNLPSHNHTLTSYRWFLNDRGNQSAWAEDSVGGQAKSATATTSSFGSAEPIEIMQPWITYLICKKI